MGSWLLDSLESFGGSPAIVWRDEQVNYRELVNEVARWVGEFDASALGPGACLAVRGDFSPALAALFLAALERRLILAPLPRSAAAPLLSLLETARAGAIIDFTSTSRPSLELLPQQAAHPLQRRLGEQGAAGLLLFSSGTTGVPKASLLNLDLLLENYRARRSPKCVLTFLQTDHIGGVNTLFAFLSSGGRLVLPTARDPDTVCSLVETYRVQLLPVTPTFLRMVLITEAYRHHDLSSLEVLTFGTEPMPPATLRELRAVFPRVSFRQTYGLTELGIFPVRTDESDPLWFRIGGEGVETKVVDGTLRVRSRTAMLGYLNAEHPFDADGWFDTQDLVEVDGDRIRVLGRVSDIINVGGEKVYPAEVEDVLMQMDGVRDVAVFGKPNPVTGQVVAARFWLDRDHGPAELRGRLRQFLRGRLAPFQVPLYVEVAEGPLHGERYKKARSPVGMAAHAAVRPHGV